MRPMSRVVFVLTALCLVILAAGCSLIPENRVRQMADEVPTPTPIPTAIVPREPRYTVKMGEIVDEITFNGRVSPVVEEELFFRTDGRIRAIYHKRDEIVTEGTVIAEYEIDALERSLKSAVLDLERVESRLATAERELEFARQAAAINLEIAKLQLNELRSSAIPDSIAVSVQEQRIRLAEIEIERLKEGLDPLLVNDVERARLNVQTLEAEIAEAQIVAPFDGRLLTVSLTDGQGVEGYRKVVSIAQIDDLEVNATLLSNQMDGLEEGMEVVISPVRNPGVVLTGAIRRLPYPYGTGGNPSNQVEDKDDSTHIAIDGSLEEIGLELGDLVRVDVLRERKDDVLWLPPQALRNFDGRRFVVLEEDGTQRRLDVTIGIETQERVEIEEGLEEGQVVVGQ